MRILAILFAIVAVSSAATVITMDEKDFEKVMGRMGSQVNMSPMMGIMALIDNQHELQEEPEAVEAEGEEEAAHDGAEEPADDQEDVEAVEAEDPRPYLNMFNNGMTGVIFPDMMMGASPYSARHPSQRPPGSNNNHELANGNGNGKRGGGSSATASATSFSKGPNSFSSSQAQAFSRGSK